ncbi:hypothetical protein ABEX38_29850 [Priestia megaterium]
MAGNKLADILVTLSLETKGFYKQLKQAGNRVEAMGKQMERSMTSVSATTSQSFENISSSTRDVGDSFSTMASSTQGSMSQMANTMGMTQREFKRFGRESGMFSQQFSADIDSLPPHLQDLSRNLTQTRDTIRNMATESTHSVEEMTKAFANTNVGFNGLTKITTDGKKAIASMRELQAESKKTQLAVMGLNETGTATISTQESQRQMEAFQRKVYETRAEIEKLKASGDFGTYNAAMQNLEHEMSRVQSSMNATAVGGMAVQKTLRSLGIVTADMGNQMAMQMERFRGSIMASVEQFNAMDTQAQKASSLLSETGGKAYGLSQQFLKVASAMEMTARKGNAMNLAIKQLGADAPMASILKRVQDINKGLTRMTQLQMYGGMAAAAMVYGLVLVSNELDGRLIPAFDRLKSVWSDAITPFIQAFTTFALVIMNGAIKLGELAAKFAEVHPQLSQMAFGFIAITIALIPLLAPLAIAIGLTDGLAAAFALLWGMVAPFVVGFAIVAGVAVLVAAAIVTVIAVINNLWSASEAFRTAWTNLWNQVVQAVSTNLVAPIQAAWANLVSAFQGVIAAFTGGSTTMGSLWTTLGNLIATGVNNIAQVVLPLLKTAFDALGQGIAFVVNGIAATITFLTNAWNNHKAQIMPILSAIGAAVSAGFQAIASFIGSVMPQIIQVATSGWDLIKAAVDFAMKYIAPVVVAAFKIIWQIIQMVMPLVLSIIVGTWNNIKSVITSAIAIITNVIQLFANILKGNFKGAWENVKNIFKNALVLIWNLVQLYMIGKLLAPLRAFGSQGLSIVRAAWTGIKTAISSVLNYLKSFIGNVWRAITSSLRGSFSGIKNLAVTTFNGLKTAVMNSFNAVKSGASRVWNAVKNAIEKPVQKAKSTVLKIIRDIVSAFARMKISIPKFKLPSVEIGSKEAFGGKVKVPTFKLNWHAKGGIFDGATMLGGGNGVGEAGAEAVMPIQHKRYMAPFASAIADNLKTMAGNKKQSNGGDQYTIVFNEPVVIREEADITKLVAEMDKKKRIQERAKGTFSYTK